MTIKFEPTPRDDEDLGWRLGYFGEGVQPPG